MKNLELESSSFKNAVKKYITKQKKRLRKRHGGELPEHHAALATNDATISICMKLTDHSIHILQMLSLKPTQSKRVSSAIQQDA